MLFMLAAQFTASLALAANLVQNSSFEVVTTTTLSGSAGVPDVPTSWTQSSNINGCGFQALQSGGVPYFGGDFTIGTGGASLPTDGTRVLISDQGPSGCNSTIYQDVAIPAGGATLTLAAGAVFRNAPNGSSVSVDVTTTGGSQLINVYSRTDTQGNDALADRPTVNLSAYAGQTVRIIGTSTVPNSNWTGLLMDNVRVMGAASSIPTLTEWGMIILSSLLALGAVFFLRRQR